MLLATVASVFDWLGIVAFAVSGALVASRKKMDLVGFAVLGTVTAIGGGTLRDLLLGVAPVFWVREPLYLIVCVVISSAMFVMPRLSGNGERVLLWFDAIGLALFAVLGAEKALEVGAGPVVAIAMGVITASFGGIIRDVLGNDSPVVFSSEVYVTAALAGASAFTILLMLGMERDLALAAGMALGLALRILAMLRNWSLPTYSI